MESYDIADYLQYHDVERRGARVQYDFKSFMCCSKIHAYYSIFPKREYLHVKEEKSFMGWMMTLAIREVA